MELTLPQNTLPLRAQWTLQYRGAAIRCVAQIIVTKNLKNFPSDVLDQYGIEAQHPDEFLEYQFGLRIQRQLLCPVSDNYNGRSLMGQL